MNGRTKKSNASHVTDTAPVSEGESRPDLTTPQRITVNVAMLPAQRKLYNLLRDQLVKQARSTLNTAGGDRLRALERHLMCLLQLVSNPALLLTASDLPMELVAAAVEEGDSPKVAYACQRARQIASQGKKVVIWSAFRQNVEIIHARLLDLGAEYLHGGVDAGDQEDLNTREGRIRRFNEDSRCQVFVANPAAAGEGISLHKVCHHAIYVDRTYNAAHYLQSEDRIHRLGSDQIPIIELVQCADSVDQSVSARLEFKVQQMAIALNDPALRITPDLTIDEDDEDESDEEALLGLDLNDVRDILRNLNAD